MTRKRTLNPAKFDRCVKDVKKRGGAANAYAVCTAAGTRNKGRVKDAALRGETAGKGTRRNPGRDEEEYQAALDASEEFHGIEPSEEFLIKTDIFEHETLAVCGELIKFQIISVNGGTVLLSEFEGAFLCQAPKGFPYQLFVEGGNQEVDLEDFDIDKPHEFEVLGKLKRVWYYTIKHHLGKDGGEANYKHLFAERKQLRGPIMRRILNGPKLPTVTYDSMSKLLGIAGGDYTILPEGIDD